MKNLAKGLSDVSREQDVLHLSDEQMDDALIGDLEGESAEHLAACADCAQRLALIAEPMTSFRDVTLAWSERRSATMPMVTVPAQGQVWQRRTGWAMATFGLAVGIVMTGSGDRFAALTKPGEAPQVESASSAPAQMAAVSTPLVGISEHAQDEDRYAADNHVLTAIDGEVTPPAESASALGLERVSDSEQRSASPALLEN